MLELINVSKYYSGDQTVTQALRKVSLTLSAGEFVAVTGESGSGKSTFLNIISGLDTYEDGDMRVNGESTGYYDQEDWEQYRSQYIGFIFQNYNIIDAYTVYQNVYAALSVSGYPKDERKTRALALIERVGLSKQKNQKSSTLSGGQKQRVSIARALAKDAPIIVADEPTGNLDKASGDNILSLLKSIAQDKLVIVVTHNFDEVKPYATRRVRLFDGEISEDKTYAEVAKNDAFSATVTRGLNLKEQFTTALRNLFSTPKRLVLMLMIAVLIVFVFSFAYGSYVEQTNAPPRGGFGPFNNPHPTRLVALNRDGAPFTQSALNDLEDLNRVQSVLRYDTILEMRVYYEGSFRSNVMIPSSSVRSSILSEGRLPTAVNEIVVSSDYDYQVGDTVTLTLNSPDYSHIGRPSPGDELLISVTFDVVGINRERFSNQVIVADEMFEDARMHLYAMHGEMRRTTIAIGNDDGPAYMFEQYRIVYDDTVPRGNIRLSEETLTEVSFSIPGNPGANALRGETLKLYQEDVFVKGHEANFVVDASFTTGYDKHTLLMHPDTMTDLFDVRTRQVTLLVRDGFDANAVANEIDQEVVQTVYPAGYSPPEFMGIYLFERVFTFLFVAFLLVVMYFMTYVALRNVMRSKTKDYLIFRSIGAMKRDLNRITVIELLITFVIAALLVFAFLWVNVLVGTRFPDFIRYYSVGNYTFAIIIFALLSILLGIRFNYRIFRDSVITALRVE